MKILMFGWELPPRVSGGLGTACAGLTEALVQQGVHLTFVVPRRGGAEASAGMTLLAADERPVLAPAPVTPPAPAAIRAPTAPAPVAPTPASTVAAAPPAGHAPVPAPPAPLPATLPPLGELVTRLAGQSLTLAPTLAPPICAPLSPAAAAAPGPLTSGTLRLLAIDSLLQPYLTPASYLQVYQQELLASITGQPGATALAGALAGHLPSGPAMMPVAIVAKLASDPRFMAWQASLEPHAHPAASASPPVTSAAPAPTELAAPVPQPAATVTSPPAPPAPSAALLRLQEQSRHYGDHLTQEVCRYAHTGAELGRQGGFDLIHAHDWMSFLAGVEAKHASGKPLVCHVHSTEFDRCGEHPNADIYRIERYGLEQADAIIAVSHRTRDALVARYGLAPERITVIHNGVSGAPTPSPSTRTRQPRDKLVLFLGRLTYQKGPEYFIAAAERVLRELSGSGLSVRFVMAGNGDLLPTLMTQVNQLGLHAHFHFTGFIGGSELEELFGQSDLYVMPSVSEPYGLTPLEAMARGVPVILSRQVGVAEALPQVETVDFWDIPALTAAIVRLLRHEGLGEAQVAASQRDLARLSWAQAATQVTALYHQLQA